MNVAATVRIEAGPDALADAAAAHAASTIRAAAATRGEVHVMFASGNSQLAFLDRLTADPAVPWDHVVGFHMDEYLGIGIDHPASFARYMRDRIVRRARPRAFHLLDGTAAPAAEAERYALLLTAHPLDLCVLGIGENGHLAFNDPGVADFTDPQVVKTVALDEVCRAQQVGEGHFAAIADVPTHALTVTIPTLLGAGSVLVIVPEARKAGPVAAALTGPVTTACPASILQRTPHATVYLEPASAAGLAPSDP